MAERLKKEYNLLKNEFHVKIEKLRKKREKLKEVQKSYFSRAKKYKIEKTKYIMKHRDAHKKPKVEEYFQKRQYYYREYKMNFREFKQLYEKINHQFEQRVLGWIKFDTQLKRDYAGIWEHAVCKLLGLNPDSPVLLGLPDREQLFADVLSKDMERLYRAGSNEFGNGVRGMSDQNLESSTVINAVKNESSPPDEEESDVKAEARRIRKKFELLYFNLDFVYLTNMNYFSCYFVDFEFNMLKVPKIKNPEEDPEKVLNFFELKKKTIGPKDIKLIEELILSLNDENQFLYEDDYYSTNRLIKRSPNHSHFQPKAVILQQTTQHQEAHPKTLRQEQHHQVRFLIFIPLPALPGNPNGLQPKRGRTGRRADHFVPARHFRQQPEKPQDHRADSAHAL